GRAGGGAASAEGRLRRRALRAGNRRRNQRQDVGAALRVVPAHHARIILVSLLSGRAKKTPLPARGERESAGVRGKKTTHPPPAARNAAGTRSARSASAPPRCRSPR